MLAVADSPQPGIISENLFKKALFLPENIDIYIYNMLYSNGQEGILEIAIYGKL